MRTEITKETALYLVLPAFSRRITFTMVFYALVEWDEDKSLSVVPVSKFLSSNAEKVKQKWGARVYAGTILQEGGKCICSNFLTDQDFVKCSHCIVLLLYWLVTLLQQYKLRGKAYKLERRSLQNRCLGIDRAACIVAGALQAGGVAARAACTFER